MLPRHPIVPRTQLFHGGKARLAEDIAGEDHGSRMKASNLDEPQRALGKGKQLGVGYLVSRIAARGVMVERRGEVVETYKLSVEGLQPD
jgi:hypothetical protein